MFQKRPVNPSPSMPCNTRLLIPTTHNSLYKEVLHLEQFSILGYIMGLYGDNGKEHRFYRDYGDYIVFIEGLYLLTAPPALETFSRYKSWGARSLKNSNIWRRTNKLGGCLRASTALHCVLLGLVQDLHNRFQKLGAIMNPKAL